MSKFYYWTQEEGKTLDPKFSSYNSGTQEMLSILDEQEFEYEDSESYSNIVENLESCRNESDIEKLMYNLGTDYIDELECHTIWMDIMFPRPEKSAELSYE